MGLKSLLAENPAAQVEFDQAIAAATAAGEKAGKEAQNAVIAKVSPFLTSTDYPETVKNAAVAVLKGDTPVGTLEAAVAAVDAVKEQMKQNAAQKETNEKGETPPEQQKQMQEGAVVSSEDDLQATVAQFKEGRF